MNDISERIFQCIQR